MAKKKKITPAQEEKARQQFLDSLGNVDQNDVTYAAYKGESKVGRLDADPPGALAQLWNDIKTMVRLLNIKNSYREVPWNIIAAVAGALAYFVMPIDVVPDFILGVGYVDDAKVIALALDLAREDLRRFEAWETRRRA